MAPRQGGLVVAAIRVRRIGAGAAVHHDDRRGLSAALPGRCEQIPGEHRVPIGAREDHPLRQDLTARRKTRAQKGGHTGQLDQSVHGVLR